MGSGNAHVVAITGVSGYLGRRLLALLDADPDVERVVGIDIAEPHAGSPKLDFHQVDVRDARLVKVLPGVDVLVHLAFQVDPIRDEERTRAVNVDGTRNVLEAAGATGIRKLVHASSAAVYGAHPDNDFPLTESSPLRANPEFSLAWHKLEAERIGRGVPGGSSRGRRDRAPAGDRVRAERAELHLADARGAARHDGQRVRTTAPARA